MVLSISFAERTMREREPGRDIDDSKDAVVMLVSGENGAGWGRRTRCRKRRGWNHGRGSMRWQRRGLVVKDAVGAAGRAGASVEGCAGDRKQRSRSGNNGSPAGLIDE